MPKRISAAAALVAVLIGGSALASAVPAQATSDDHIVTTLVWGVDYLPRSEPPDLSGGGLFYSADGRSISFTTDGGGLSGVSIKAPLMGGTRPFEITNGSLAGKCFDLWPDRGNRNPLPIVDCSVAPAFTFKQMSNPSGRLFWTLYSPGRGYADDGGFFDGIDEYTDDFSKLAAKASATFSFEKRSALNDRNGNSVGDVGESVTYSFVVTNTGPSALSSVSVSAPMVGAVTCPAGSVAPGASVTCTAAPLVLTQAHVDAGEIRNTATATATSPTSDPVTQTATNTFTVGPRTGAFSLAKRAALNDANGNGVADVGESVAYSFVATNTGRVTLTDVAVSAPMVGAVTCPAGSVAPGASVTCAAAPLALTQAHVGAGEIKNAATATAKDPTGATVSHDVSNTFAVGPRTGAFSFEKKAALDDRNGNCVGDAGELLTYSFVVTNTGRVTLSGVKVADSMVGTVTCPAGDLAPGASATCTAAPLVLTQAHLSAGEIKNTATASAKTPAGNDVSQAATNVWSALAPPEKKATLAITGIDLPLPGIVALVGALVASGAALRIREFANPGVPGPASGIPLLTR